MNYHLTKTVATAFTFLSLDRKEVFVRLDSKPGHFVIADRNLNMLLEVESDYSRINLYKDLLFATSNHSTRIYKKEKDAFVFLQEEKITNLQIHNDLLYHFSIEDGGYYLNEYSLLSFEHKNKIKALSSSRLIFPGDGSVMLCDDLGTKLYKVHPDASVETFTIKLYTTKKKHQKLHYLTQHKEHIVCIANQDTFIGVNFANGKTEWEVDTVYDMSGIIHKTEQVYAADLLVDDDSKKIYSFGAGLSEFDLEKREFRQKINWFESAQYDILSRTSSFYNSRIYYTGHQLKDLSDKNWNKTGVFNPLALSFEWEHEIHIPKGVSLNNAPIADTDYLYITDSANTLHIFEKE